MTIAFTIDSRFIGVVQINLDHKVMGGDLCVFFTQTLLCPHTESLMDTVKLWHMATNVPSRVQGRGVGFRREGGPSPLFWVRETQKNMFRSELDGY